MQVVQEKQWSSAYLHLMPKFMPQFFCKRLFAGGLGWAPLPSHMPLIFFTRANISELPLLHVTSNLTIDHNRFSRKQVGREKSLSGRLNPWRDLRVCTCYPPSTLLALP